MECLVIMLDPTVVLEVYGETVLMFELLTLTLHHSITQKLKNFYRDMKRKYNRRIMNIEHGTFTPLVFSVSSVLGKECSMFHKHMAKKIAKK